MQGSTKTQVQLPLVTLRLHYEAVDGLIDPFKVNGILSPYKSDVFNSLLWKLLLVGGWYIVLGSGPWSAKPEAWSDDPEKCAEGIAANVHLW